ncbi:sensor histidine kinase [Albirhodobacter sp. R86504]|uniref:sensor histidine kinase n=1 Tax=Albirhodobacter sp. R86504 TaxID=3093848 RepID=UPI00366BECA8
MWLTRRFDKVAVRLALLLAVALFPIGLIAVLQSRHIAETVDQRSEEALLALTAEAAGNEIALVREGFGALDAMMLAMPRLLENPAECSQFFRSYVANSAVYSFAGYINKDGLLVCANSGVGRSLETSTSFTAQSGDPKRRATMNADAPISRTSVVILSQPYFVEGVFEGYVAVSLPHARIFDAVEKGQVPIDLITFNKTGVVMSARDGLEGVEKRLPAKVDLAALTTDRRMAFTGRTNGGDEMAFAVVPIVEGTLYAIGAWPRERFVFSSFWTVISPLVLPVLMWAACLAIAFFGIHSLVIRHIKRMGAEMNAFIDTRKFNPQPISRSMPTEIREIEQTWLHLAETVVRDEAELEGTIHDKTVLLKEVHHRVKNNLQLISSIINMKLRKVQSPGVRAALQDIQMRVMSIASVHRSLYEGDQSGRVRADKLLHAVVDMTIEAGSTAAAELDVDLDYAPIALYPDQAVPLSLMAGEAVTNALKYYGSAAPGERAWIKVRLELLDAKRARFIAENSSAPELATQSSEGGGLGTSLIEAFAMQMRGRALMEPLEGSFRLTVEFPIAEFSPPQAS